jgi:hypothetical protein
LPPKILHLQGVAAEAAAAAVLAIHPHYMLRQSKGRTPLANTDKHTHIFNHGKQSKTNNNNETKCCKAFVPAALQTTTPQTPQHIMPQPHLFLSILSEETGLLRVATASSDGEVNSSLLLSV